MAIYMPRHPSELRKIRIGGRLSGLRTAREYVRNNLEPGGQRDRLIDLIDFAIAEAERDYGPTNGEVP